MDVGEEGADAADTRDGSGEPERRDPVLLPREQEHTPTCRRAGPCPLAGRGSSKNRPGKVTFVSRVNLAREIAFIRHGTAPMAVGDSVLKPSFVGPLLAMTWSGRHRFKPLGTPRLGQSSQGIAAIQTAWRNLGAIMARQDRMFLSALRQVRTVLAVTAAALLIEAGALRAQGQDDTAPSVIVAGVASREIADVARFIGRVEPADSVDLRPRVTGFLEARLVSDGVYVSRGDLLFTIEEDQYAAALAQANAEVAQSEANLALASLDLDRRARLLQSNTIAQAEYDSSLAARDAALANRDAAAAMARRAELDLGYTKIRAPFEGRIGRIAFSEGDIVGPDAGPLTTLVRVTPIEVAFSLGEGQFLSVVEAIGSDLRDDVDPSKSPPVTLLLPNREAFEETGQIVFLDNRVDPMTGTIALRARFENARGLLTPGMFVTVEIGQKEADMRLVAPQAAVQRDQRGSFVLVVGPEGMVQKRYVELGQQAGTDIVVVGGLQEGESVIVEGLQRVRPGVPVNAVRADAAAD